MAVRRIYLVTWFCAGFTALYTAWQLPKCSSINHDTFMLAKSWYINQGHNYSNNETYRKFGNFHCWNIFIVPVDYEIKYHEIFSTLKLLNGEILESVRMHERMYVQLQQCRMGRSACSRINHNLAAYLSQFRCLQLWLRLISMAAH